MMARTHALSGAAAWLAAAPVIDAATAISLASGEVIAGAVVTAGAALLPDLDHPQATVSRALGPVSQLLSRGVHAAAGGHRQATHSLLFVVLTGLAMWALAEVNAEPVLGTAVAALCVGLAVRAVGPRQMHRGGWVDLTLIAWTLVLTGVGVLLVGTLTWLPLAVTGGVLLHLVGDLVTPRGVPLLWPRPGRYAVPLLGATDGVLEQGLGLVLLVAIVWLGVPLASG